MKRRNLMKVAAGAATWLSKGNPAPLQIGPSVRDLAEYLSGVSAEPRQAAYRQLLGAANEFKEGDAAAGVAALDQASRRTARRLLSRTKLRYVVENPVYEDSVSLYIQQGVDSSVWRKIADWDFGQLKNFFLRSSEPQIREVMPGLHSDVIACVVKLMTNNELIVVSRKIYNPLPGSSIGANGYLGARIQPNSPTDDLEDIQWQVFNGFCYGVGDVVLGTNPVSSNVESVSAIEHALADILRTFELQDILPHCVLAHIDIQAQAEAQHSGSTALWFQSLAGVADANKTFDLTVAKMVDYAAQRTGKYGFYFETGQGADGSNGHSKGFDIVMHESRKYGFARALRTAVSAAQRKAGRAAEPWVHLNDVAGFIGPEVFRTPRQLVRCCLEDTLMGKLHGLTIGLDICSTLHMDIDLDDLDWCMDQIMPANPAYLMALPTKNDPMLSYVTTAFQDHVRLRKKFGFKINDRMAAFFRFIGVLDSQDQPGPNFGRPERVYLEFQRRKGDVRSDDEILADARIQMNRVRSHGVDLAEGQGRRSWDLAPALDRKVRSLYADARKCIWAELPPDFASRLGAVSLRTMSRDREDYILHPSSGEQLASGSQQALQAIREFEPDVQIVISDGLDALSLLDEGHLQPFLDELRRGLTGIRLGPQPIVVQNGRVRAGYRIGESLFGSVEARDQKKTILHIIGERPGSGHRAYSVYLTNVAVRSWADSGAVDHNLTRVISGISNTSFDPRRAAREAIQLIHAGHR